MMGPYLRRTLETGDLREAQRRRWDVLEWARAEIAKRGEAVGKSVVGKGDATYEAFRARLRDAGPATFEDEGTGELVENPAFDAALEALAEAHSD